MTESLTSAPVIMATVAALLAIAAIWVFTRPGGGEAGVYGRRIAGTMLGSGAIVLAIYAWSLHSWGAGR